MNFSHEPYFYLPLCHIKKGRKEDGTYQGEVEIGTAHVALVLVILLPRLLALQPQPLHALHMRKPYVRAGIFGQVLGRAVDPDH